MKTGPSHCLNRHSYRWLTLVGPSWPWLYDSWIYNYLCNQCLSQLMWVRISIRARCTTLCDKVCQWLATGRWFSLGPLVSSTNKTDCHDITEILLKVVLNTIKQTNKQTNLPCFIKYLVFYQNIDDEKDGSSDCHGYQIFSRHFPIQWVLQGSTCCI